MRKLAVIRDNKTTLCPFGLSVSQGCHTAGDLIDQMQLIENEENIQQIIDHNIQILTNSTYAPQRCKYAAHLFKHKPNIVDCDFGEPDAGLFPKTTIDGINHLQHVQELGMGRMLNDITHLPENFEHQNLYYGIHSQADKRQFKMILRYALLRAMIKING